MFVWALPFAFVGVSLLIALHWVYGVQKRTANDALVIALSIAGWVLVFIGATISLTPVGNVVLIILAGFLLLILAGMIVAKYRLGERRALLLSLAIASEKGLPLAAAARAFARQRYDEIARRASYLADLLDAGVPLGVAMAQSKNPLPDDATLMTRLSETSNVTATALRDAAEHGGQIDDSLKPIYEQFLYLLFVMLVMVFVTTFLVVQVIPTFKMIFEDFDAQLPLVTRFAFWCASLFGDFGSPTGAVVTVAAMGLLCGLVVSVFVVSINYVQGRVWIPALLSKLLGGADSPNVLRGLALGVDQGIPMHESLERIAKNYPKTLIRRQAATAAAATRSGSDWIQALRSSKLITHSEAAVLSAASRVGNLGWALRELAEIGTRRFIYRAKAALNVAAPVSLLLLAVPLAVIALGCISPMAKLILGLSGS